MHRFFAPKGDIFENVAALSREEAGHMGVLRLKVGDAIEVIDGEGGRFSAEIIDLSGNQREVKSAKARIIAPLPSNEAAVKITLYHGLPKAAKAELVVQKCTELGFFAYAPVQMRYCDVKLADGAKKLDRLGKIALEAAKQSGRSHIPTIFPAAELKSDELLAMMRAHDALILPWEKAARAFAQALSGGDSLKDIGIVIGPEGGIGEDEVEYLTKNAGAVTVTLGGRILRTETAAISAVAAAMCLLGEWR